MDGYLSHDGTLAKVDSAPTTMKENTVRRGSPYRAGNADRARWGAASHSKHGRHTLLIDADGIANVPVESNGAPVTPICLARRWSPILTTTIAISVYRFKQLAGRCGSHPVGGAATLTEGAIGYRKFKVISGQKRWRYCGCVTVATRRLARK